MVTSRLPLMLGGYKPAYAAVVGGIRLRSRHSDGHSDVVTDCHSYVIDDGHGDVTMTVTDDATVTKTSP